MRKKKRKMHNRKKKKGGRWNRQSRREFMTDEFSRSFKKSSIPPFFSTPPHKGKHSMFVVALCIDRKHSTHTHIYIRMYTRTYPNAFTLFASSAYWSRIFAKNKINKWIQEFSLLPLIHEIQAPFIYFFGIKNFGNKQTHSFLFLFF